VAPSYDVLAFMERRTSMNDRAVQEGGVAQLGRRSSITQHSERVSRGSRGGLGGDWRGITQGGIFPTGKAGVAC